MLYAVALVLIVYGDICPVLTGGEATYAYHDHGRTAAPYREQVPPERHGADFLAEEPQARGTGRTA